MHLPLELVLSSFVPILTLHFCFPIILQCRQEMILRYPDQEATMGEARLVGETGPDEAGKRLTPTTIKVSIICRTCANTQHVEKTSF
jgi:hypothetical protein